MDNRIVLNAVDEPLQFLLVSSADHISPITGVTPTVMISKNGGVFARPAGTVVEVGFGWYEVVAHANDVNTNGPLILHASAAGADPFDDLYWVLPTASSAALVQYRTDYPLVFLMVRSSDHITGAVGVRPLVMLCQYGQTWEILPTGGGGSVGYGWYPFTNQYQFNISSVSGSAVFEIGYGWYGILLTAPQVEIAGPLLLHATYATCDNSDTRFDIYPAPQPSTSLLGAIVTHFKADPTLDVITGNIFTMFAPEDADTPYVIVQELASSPALFTSSNQRDQHTINFRIYSANLDGAGQYGDLIEASYKNVPLHFTGGVASPLKRIGGVHGIGGYGPEVTRSTGWSAYPLARDGARSWYHEVKFLTRVRLIS